MALERYCPEPRWIDFSSQRRLARTKLQNRIFSVYSGKVSVAFLSSRARTTNGLREGSEDRRTAEFSQARLTCDCPCSDYDEMGEIRCFSHLPSQLHRCHGVYSGDIPKSF